MMLPAPRNPTPVITPWMMRVGSRLGPPMFSTACLVTSTNIVEPRHTSVWVRSPAGLRPSWRSQPIIVPNTVETSIARRSWIMASLALEPRRPLLEERVQSLVHVLARGQDAEQAAFEPEPCVERKLAAAVHGLEHCGDRQRAVLRDRLRQLVRLVEELLARHHAIHEPDPQRLVGLDAPRRQHELERPPGADQPRQPLRASVAGDDAEAHLRQPQHGVLAREPHVAGQRQLA